MIFGFFGLEFGSQIWEMSYFILLLASENFLLPSPSPLLINFLEWNGSPNWGHSSRLFYLHFSRVFMTVWMLSQHLCSIISPFLSTNFSPLCTLACAICLCSSNSAVLNFSHFPFPFLLVYEYLHHLLIERL